MVCNSWTGEHNHRKSVADPTRARMCGSAARIGAARERRQRKKGIMLHILREYYQELIVSVSTVIYTVIVDDIGSIAPLIGRKTKHTAEDACGA